MLVTATYSQQMTEVMSSTSSFDQLNNEDGACCIFAGENRQLKFLRTLYPNYHFKEQKCFFFFVIIIIIVLGKKLERFCIGTDMLSADRFRQHRENIMKVKSKAIIKVISRYFDCLKSSSGRKISN